MVDNRVGEKATDKPSPRPKAKTASWGKHWSLSPPIYYLCIQKRFCVCVCVCVSVSVCMHACAYVCVCMCSVPFFKEKPLFRPLCYYAAGPLRAYFIYCKKVALNQILKFAILLFFCVNTTILMTENH